MDSKIFCWKCGVTKYAVDSKQLSNTCLQFGEELPHEYAVLMEDVLSLFKSISETSGTKFNHEIIKVPTKVKFKRKDGTYVYLKAKKLTRRK